MGRQANGTWVQPAGNPVVAATTIDASWANTLVPDLGNDIADSLSRSGQGGMLAALKGVDGAAATPSYSFSTEASSGLYRQGAGDIRLSVLGADYMRWVNGSRPEWWSGTAWEGLALNSEKANKANPAFTGSIGLGTTSVNAAELAILQNATISTGELNRLAGAVGDTLQNQINGKAAFNGNAGQVFNIAAPTANSHAIRRTTYAAASTGGTVKMRVASGVLYLTNNGVNA